MSRRLRIPMIRAALLLALVAVLSLPLHVEAGSGTVVTSGTDKGRIDLTIKFTYPPQAADIAALEEAIDEASVFLCDATEGQMRLGNVTVTGGSTVGDEDADVLVLPENGRSNASLCLMGYGVACSSLSQPGAHVNLYRDDLDGRILAHELGHLVFDLGDEYDEQSRLGACWGVGRCIECNNVSGQHTCLMQESDCGLADDASELCRTSDHDPVGGDPMAPACTPANQLACNRPCEDNCAIFNPSTCRYDMSHQTAWSLSKFGQVLSCWSHLVLTFPFLTEQVGNPDVQPQAQCSTAPEVTLDVEPVDQVMMVLDRSWSMNFLPNTGQCVGAGCPEICNNNYDDDQDGLKDMADTCEDKQTRLDFLKEAAQAFVDLNAGHPLLSDVPDLGVSSFQCVSSLDQPLQTASTFNADNNLIPAIQALKPNGNTAIGDALVFAADQMPDEGLNRDLLLITDGQQNCGANTTAAAASQLAKQGIRVYTITFGEATNDGAMAGVAGTTRGRHVNAGDDRDLVSSFVQQWAHYKNAGLLIPKLRYRVGAASPGPEPANRARGAQSWLQGQFGPVGDSGVNSPAYNSNGFTFQVEPGTDRFVVSLAGDMASMTGFGIRATLQGPAGPNPSAYDTSGPSTQANFELLDGRFYRLLIVSRPNPGPWRLNVLHTKKTGHAAVQTGKVTVVSQSANTDLFTSLDRRVVSAPGQTVRLIARPVYKSQLRNVTLQATVRWPDGTYHPVALTGGDDFMTNFLGQINNFPLRGPYEVRVYLRTGAGTQNHPGESRFPGPSNAVTVPLLERTATEQFYVSTGQPPCSSQLTANCYQQALQ